MPIMNFEIGFVLGIIVGFAIVAIAHLIVTSSGKPELGEFKNMRPTPPKDKNGKQESEA